MKKLIFIPALIFHFTAQTFSQSDCSNPLTLDICPPVMLYSETNAGKGDDGPGPCNIAGEDVVYELLSPNGARQVFVSVVNATGPMTIYLEEMVCGTGLCTSTNISAGNTNLTFNVSNFNSITKFFLWADAQNTVTYDISFGADTGTVWINIPDTQGDLSFDSSFCSTPVFHPAKPFFKVTFNGVPQVDPMTLAPLFVPGTMCVSTFFKNTTGIEGVKRFNFKFNPVGYQSVTGPPAIPGNYISGNWVTFSSGLNWHYTFYDTPGTGKGDFSGVPNTCLTYEFCFTIIPLSNDPQLTNVDVDIIGDGFGAPYSGWSNVGCCPIPFVNCLMGSFGPGSGANATGMGFGFADPGGPLPIQLLEFSGTPAGDRVDLKWITATETNNDYFTIQRSVNGQEWNDVTFVDGAGTSTIEIVYKFTDEVPLAGISYYRLKQTDFDGKSSESQMIVVNMEEHNEVKIYPNPAKDQIVIETSGDEPVNYKMMSYTGSIIQLTGTRQSNQTRISLSHLPRGLYFLLVEREGITIRKEKVILQ